MTQWIEFDSADDVAAAVADTIAECSIQAIRQRGTFKIVLAGGTTPLTCYQLLAGRPLDFEHWQVFYGDERCLPEHDPQRNHQLVAGTGLSERVGRHFIIPAQLGPEKGAESYAHTVNTAVPFDLVLLGMGEDGHTASLFPALDWERKTIVCESDCGAWGAQTTPAKDQSESFLSAGLPADDGDCDRSGQTLRRAAMATG